MMGADEKFVREHWVGQDPIEVLVIDDPMPEFCSASVRIRGFGPCFYRSTQEEAWAAASEFTRNRLEEIRQLECDIDRIEYYFWSASNWQENLDDLEEQGQVVDAVRQQCADVRIVARLQAALAELKRGMK